MSGRLPTAALARIITMASSAAGRCISKDSGHGALRPTIDFVRAVK